jgi:hypothetical protein
MIKVISDTKKPVKIWTSNLEDEAEPKLGPTFQSRIWRSKPLESNAVKTMASWMKFLEPTKILTK